MSAPTLRDATAADLDFVLAGLAANRRIEGRDADAARATEEDRRAYAQAIAAARVRVLEEDGAPIGFLSFALDFEVMYVPPPFLWVDLVFVHAAHRGRGLGRRLYDEAARIARDEGCTRVVADVFASNEASTAFHRRMGFAASYTIFERPVGDD